MTCDEFERQLIAGETRSSAAGQEFLEHVLDCKACRSLWFSRAILSETEPGPLPAPPGDCPPPERILGAVDGSLRPTERRSLLQHIGDCERCTKELIRLLHDLDRLDDAALSAPSERIEARAIELARPAGVARPHRTAQTRRWSIGLAVAAGVFFVALGVGLLWFEPGVRLPADYGSVLRGASKDEPVPIAPRGAVRSTSGLQFSWSHERGAQPRYRLVVVDLEQARTILEVVTDETSYTLAPEQAALLHPDLHYHWIVEPLGGSPSEATRFWLSP